MGSAVADTERKTSIGEKTAWKRKRRNARDERESHTRIGKISSCVDRRCVIH